MTLTESVNHPQSFDLHSFSPFHSLGPSEVGDTYHSFDNIRSNCKYYCSSVHNRSVESAVSISDSFSIIHVNARSILSDDKFDEFSVFLYKTQCNWSIICVSETWLCNDMEERRHLSGYTGYFDSRVDGIGGGVAVYVRNDVIRKTIKLPKVFKDTESLLIECHLNNNFSFILCQTYKPPILNVNNFIEDLSSVLDIVQTRKKTAFICGDFNINLLSIADGGSALDFFNTLASFSFLPLISKPTRVQDSSTTLIDNIFCNNLNIIVRNGVILDDTSDHFPIFITVNI